MLVPRILPPLSLAALLVATAAGAQTTPPAGTAPPAASAVAPAVARQDEEAGLPVSLDRIRRGLAREDTLARAAEQEWRPMFRVEVDGQLPSFSTFIGEGESLSGPAPWGSMTHGDFLQMVTPPQARSFGASTNGDLLQVLATSLLSGFAVQGAMSAARAVPDIIRRGREAAARREVQQVLAELDRRRREEAQRQRAAEDERRKAEAAGVVAPPGPGR